MQENTETTRDKQLDEELADVLIAISVIAKRLARKLQTTNQERRMGKMSDLDLQIKELRSCGETILEIAETLAGIFSSHAAEDTPPKAVPKEKLKTPAFEEVRHRMTVIAQAGYSAEVKALITKYGARKLSDIDPSQFEGLLKEADALGKPEAGNDG